MEQTTQRTNTQNIDLIIRQYKFFSRDRRTYKEAAVKLEVLSKQLYDVNNTFDIVDRLKYWNRIITEHKVYQRRMYEEVEGKR